MNSMMPNQLGAMPGMNMMNMNRGMMNQMTTNDISMYITTQPSCTIIVCDIPMDCSDRDLNGIMAKYGIVKDVQKTPDNKNALVEFQDINIANQLVSMGRSNPFYVGSNLTRLEFSSQKIFRPGNMNANVTQNHMQAPPQVNLSVDSGEPGVTNILHIEISNAQYPITTEVLNTICSPNGKVSRICIGKKSADNIIEALVEFESASDAKGAKENLNGADIYSGCCTLSITYSKLTRVHVVKNDSESWDYTNPTPGKEGLLGSQPQSKTLLSDNTKLISNTSIPGNPMGGGMNMMNPNMNNPGMNMGMNNMQPPMGNMMGMNNMGMPNQMGMNNMNMPNQMGMGMNGPNQMGMGMNSPNQMGMGMNGPNQMGMGMNMNGPNQMGMGMNMNGPNQMGMGMNPMGGMGGPMNMGGNSSDYFTMRPPPGAGLSPAMLAKGQFNNKKGASSNSKLKSADMTATFDTGDGVVLMCYNLAESMSCDHLFNLFCVYGNVAKIKFLKSRQGCAMIQMGCKGAAELVLKHYDGVTIFGKQIQVCRSKQTEVQDLNSTATLENGTPISKNYMNDPNNRFKNQVVASKSRILEPFRTLHFFNAPPKFTMEDLVNLYRKPELKVPVKACVFPSKGNVTGKTSLGLIEWETLEDALEMMALTNHYEVTVPYVSHPFHLKLAFSPRNIQEESEEETTTEGDDTESKPIAGQKRKLEQ